MNNLEFFKVWLKTKMKFYVNFIACTSKALDVKILKILSKFAYSVLKVLWLQLKILDAVFLSFTFVACNLLFIQYISLISQFITCKPALHSYICN